MGKKYNNIYGVPSYCFDKVENGGSYINHEDAPPNLKMDDGKPPETYKYFE